MKLKNFRTHNKFGNLFSITENESDINVIYQQPDSLSVHNPDKKFLLVSSEVGYFNKITQFISGDISSMLFLTSNGELQTPSITEVSNNPQKYFMLYPLPFSMFPETINTEVDFTWECSRYKRKYSNTESIKLNFELGLSVGKTFFHYTKNNKVPLTKFQEAINGSENNDFFWPHKNIILNSNIEFNLGILFGYIKESIKIFGKDQDPQNSISIKEKMYINKTNNSYIFSTILNWLGASYYFQPLKETIKVHCENFNDYIYKSDMRMVITLPHYLLNHFNKLRKLFPEYEEFQKIFKSHEWYITPKNTVRKMPIGTKEKAKVNYNELIDTGKIRIVPMSSFKFIDVTEKEKKTHMYDLSMPRADATNYALAFTPVLKNSDGDILTMSSISSREAIEDSKVFEPSHKGWFRNLNTGEINNYIADDAVLGLYAATKFLTK